MKKKENNAKTNNRAWLVLAGAVLGGAATIYFLNTPKGKKFRKSVAKSTEALTTNLKGKVDHSLETMNEVSHNIMEKANDVKKNLVHGLQEKTYDRLDSFEKGITKAKNKIKAETSKA